MSPFGGTDKHKGAERAAPRHLCHPDSRQTARPDIRMLLGVTLAGVGHSGACGAFKVDPSCTRHQRQGRPPSATAPRPPHLAGEALLRLQGGRQVAYSSRYSEAKLTTGQSHVASCCVRRWSDAQSQLRGEESMVPPARPPGSFPFAFHGLVSEPIFISSSELRNQLGYVRQTAAVLRHPSLSPNQEAFPPLPGLIPHAATAFPTSSARSAPSHSLQTSRIFRVCLCSASRSALCGPPSSDKPFTSLL